MKPWAKVKSFLMIAFGASVGILLALVLVYTLKVCCPEPVAMPIEAEPRGIVGPRVPYETHYYAAATEDHWAQLVDLSDNPGYPHANTNSIILKYLRYDATTGSADEWHWRVGVVVGAPTVTDTNIIWITGGNRTRSMFWGEQWAQPEHGLNLLVDDDETLMFVLSNELTTTKYITSGTVLPSPVACLTGTVGVGDLLLFLDEITGTATLRFTVDTSYDTD